MTPLRRYQLVTQRWLASLLLPFARNFVSRLSSDSNEIMYQNMFRP